MRASITSTPALASRSWISRFRCSATVGGVPAQRRVRVVVRVVGVAGGEVAQRRLALDVDVVLVVVHLEHGFGRVDDPPHDDGGDLDRVAIVVVDLEVRALEVADPQRDLRFCVERIGPAQPRVFAVPT